MESNDKLPLAGIRVLDLTHRLAGPTLTMFLGDWGADVIKVEWRYRMDAWRGMISIEHDTDHQQRYEKNIKWLKLNRNKRGVTLNLKSDRGRELFLRMAEKSDIVTENFSAGVTERLGIGFAELSHVNPGIIMISMPGFGNEGPHAEFVSNGATIEGYAGIASVTGYEDRMPRNSVGIWPDPVAGIHGAVAVSMALVSRHKTGKGQYIELSQAEAMMSFIGESILEYTVNGNIPEPIGNSDPEMAPHGCYQCRGEDSWVTLSVATDAEWKALCQVANHLECLKEEKFETRLLRWENRHQLNKIIEGWTSNEDAWELTQRLQQAGVAAAPVVKQEDFEADIGLPSEGFYQYFEHPYLNRYPGSAGRLDGRALPIRRAAPMLGEHNEEVYGTLLGLSVDETKKLREEGVI